MPTPEEPIVGNWYEEEDGRTFEVVAVDDDDEIVEVQYYDGTLGEYDLSTWYELGLESIEPPDDWSGAYEPSIDLDDTDESFSLEDWDEKWDQED